jgi:antimicrobial peptide system SdpA family protein
MKISTMSGETRILFLTRVSLAIFWALVIGYIALVSVVDHPLRASYRERQNLVAVSPQGWAFFTRNPREPVELIYQHDGAKWGVASYSNSSLANVWGTRRAARMLSVEANAMVNEISPESWIPCKNTMEICLHQAPPPVRVENKSALQNLCGEVVVERRPPVPWAWSRRIDKIHMPGKLVRFEAVCQAASGRSRRVHS